MEIILGVIVLAIIIFVVGGIDNDRPVSEWSDEKLVRMREKLQKAASANFDAGNMESYKQHSEKKKEVDNEIIKRERSYQEEQTQTLTQENLFPIEPDLIITEKAIDEAENGDSRVQFLVGSGYLYGANGLTNNLEKAHHYLRKAAGQDHPFASFVLAGLYAEGIGVKQDLEEARIWALKAQVLGFPDADKMLNTITIMKSNN